MLLNYLWSLPNDEEHTDSFMILTLLHHKALEHAYGWSINMFYLSLIWPVLTVLFFGKCLIHMVF